MGLDWVYVVPNREPSGPFCDAAIEYRLVQSNPFRGKRRHVKESKPRRTWLELSDVPAILDVAHKHRALLATMIPAGLFVVELMALRPRDVDLANARLIVAESKRMLNAGGRRNPVASR